jgi:hypothetical protein
MTVSNSTPLIAFARIGELGLLNQFRWTLFLFSIVVKSKQLH